MKKELFQAAPSLFVGIVDEAPRKEAKAPKAKAFAPRPEVAAALASAYSSARVFEALTEDLDYTPLNWVVEGGDLARQLSHLKIEVEAFSEAEAIQKAFAEYGEPFEVYGAYDM